MTTHASTTTNSKALSKYLVSSTKSKEASELKQKKNKGDNSEVQGAGSIGSFWAEECHDLTYELEGSLGLPYWAYTVGNKARVES